MTTQPQLNPAAIYGAAGGATHPARVVIEQANVENHADMLRQMSVDSMRRKLDAIGVDWFLDMVSGGYLLEELALSVRVRVAVLRAWLRERVPEQDYMDAQSAGAAYYRIKALRTVEAAAPADQVALGHMKLKMVAYREMAEDMDPAEWNAPPSNAAQMGVANVVINMPDGMALGGVQQFGPGVASIPLAHEVIPAQPQTLSDDPSAKPAGLDPMLAQILAKLGVDFGGANG